MRSSYRSICFASARMASLAFKPYFSRSAASLQRQSAVAVSSLQVQLVFTRHLGCPATDSRGRSARNYLSTWRVLFVRWFVEAGSFHSNFLVTDVCKHCVRAGSVSRDWLTFLISRNFQAGPEGPPHLVFLSSLLITLTTLVPQNPAPQNSLDAVI
jgi:hypothetical protein